MENFPTYTLAVYRDICQSNKIAKILQNIELYNEPLASEKNFDVNPLTFTQIALGTNHVFYSSELKKDDFNSLKEIAKKLKIKLSPTLE